MENYVYSMKNTIEDPTKLKDKLSDEEKETIKEALAATTSWMESHSDADKEQFEEQLKEIEGVCNPIISKIYQ